jgi:hypothetical protein
VFKSRHPDASNSPPLRGHTSKMKKQMVVPMCLRGAPPRGGGQQFSTLRPRDMPPRDARSEGGASFAGASRGALVAPPPRRAERWGGRRRPQAHIVGAAKLLALAAIMLGLSYTAVPLYQIFCQTSGFGGTAVPPQATPDRPIAPRVPEGGATCGGDAQEPSPGGSGGHVPEHGEPRQGAGAPGGGRTTTGLPFGGTAPICVDGTSDTQQQASQITINFAADVSDRSA